MNAKRELDRKSPFSSLQGIILWPISIDTKKIYVCLVLEHDVCVLPVSKTDVKQAPQLFQHDEELSKIKADLELQQ